MWKMSLVLEDETQLRDAVECVCVCVCYVRHTYTHLYSQMSRGASTQNTCSCRANFPRNTLISRAIHTRTRKRHAHTTTQQLTYVQTHAHSRTHTFSARCCREPRYRTCSCRADFPRNAHMHTQIHAHLHINTFTHIRAHTHVYTPFQPDVAGSLFAEHVLVVPASRAKRPNPPTMSISHVPLPSRHFL